jgi:uncharacterized membrane protein YraQ (UPF0718 family)
MILIASITGVALILSFIFSREKTIAGIIRGFKMFFNVLPFILNILVVVSVVLYAVPEKTIVRWLGGEGGLAGFSLAAVIGAVSLIPGFVAFPLASVLLKSGASYGVVAVFITTLLMTGVITLPLEAKYFGMRTAVVRNALSFIGAIVIGLIIGWLM